MTVARIGCGGARFVADPSGALMWPEREVVVVADLHLEKGSSFARRGTFLPPYDTRATLAKLEGVLARHRPRRVVSLGDAFHDVGGALRLAAADRTRLRRLIEACEWLWVSGNHDPEAPDGLGGRGEAAVELDGIVFRHCPTPGRVAAEVAGHLHPKAGVTVRSRRLSRPCFIGDRQRLVLPAFGSYTGGLDVRDPAITALFPDGSAIHLLGRAGVYRLPNGVPRDDRNA